MHWCKLVQPLWKTVWKFLKKLKTDLPYDATIPLLGIFPKKPKKISSKRYTQSNVYSIIIYNSQDMETTETSINR